MDRSASMKNFGSSKRIQLRLERERESERGPSWIASITLLAVWTTIDWHIPSIFVRARMRPLARRRFRFHCWEIHSFCDLTALLNGNLFRIIWGLLPVFGWEVISVQASNSFAILSWKHSVWNWQSWFKCLLKTDSLSAEGFPSKGNTYRVRAIKQNAWRSPVLLLLLNTNGICGYDAETHSLGN